MPRCHFLRIWTAYAICAAGHLPAQNTLAELQGAVHDPSGARVPNARISVRNAATGIARATSSNGAGIFNVPDLQPSDYEVTVSASGFATERLTNIDLAVGAQQVLNITLSPATGETTIEVKADSEDVDLANASLGG